MKYTIYKKSDGNYAVLYTRESWDKVFTPIVRSCDRSFILATLEEIERRKK